MYRAVSFFLGYRQLYWTRLRLVVLLGALVRGLHPTHTDRCTGVPSIPRHHLVRFGIPNYVRVVPGTPRGVLMDTLSFRQVPAASAEAEVIAIIARFAMVPWITYRSLELAHNHRDTFQLLRPAKRYWGKIDWGQVYKVGCTLVHDIPGEKRHWGVAIKRSLGEGLLVEGGTFEAFYWVRWRDENPSYGYFARALHCSITSVETMVPGGAERTQTTSSISLLLCPHRLSMNVEHRPIQSTGSYASEAGYTRHGNYYYDARVLIYMSPHNHSPEARHYEPQHASSKGACSHEHQ